jgi:putative transposase
MPRLARVDIGDEIYHVINRANGRLTIFEKKADYQLFESILKKAKEETDMRILAYTIMPNHWHLVLQPRTDGDLGTFMHKLTNSHTRQVRTSTKTIGHGHLYQGRYKSFIVSDDSYLLTLIKYVERNPVRAKLVTACEAWQWGSAWIRTNGSAQQKKLLSESPTPFPKNYLSWINTPDKEEDVVALRNSVNKGLPFGKDGWVDNMVDKYKLETTRRAVGRPRKS